MFVMSPSVDFLFVNLKPIGDKIPSSIEVHTATFLTYNYAERLAHVTEYVFCLVQRLSAFTMTFVYHIFHIITVTYRLFITFIFFKLPLGNYGLSFCLFLLIRVSTDYHTDVKSRVKTMKSQLIIAVCCHLILQVSYGPKH